MNCERARALIAEELAADALPGNLAVDLNAHLSECGACGTEAAAVRATWSRMGEVPRPEPRPYMATRFYAALDAYQQGMREQPSRGSWRWWPSKPAWQFAVALGCLAIGFFGGPFVTGFKRPAADDMAELRKEVSGMRQLVTLSLLQQQSASERLRGVTYSYRAEPDDMQVLSALLQTAKQDSSVDVRLAAIDALRNFSNNSVARRGLVQALETQDSPLTQIAVIDALVEMRERSAADAMRQLLAEPQLDENVRKRINVALINFQ